MNKKPYYALTVAALASATGLVGASVATAQPDTTNSPAMTVSAS